MQLCINALQVGWSVPPSRVGHFPAFAPPNKSHKMQKSLLHKYSQTILILAISAKKYLKNMMGVKNTDIIIGEIHFCLFQLENWSSARAQCSNPDMMCQHLQGKPSVILKERFVQLVGYIVWN